MERMLNLKTLVSGDNLASHYLGGFKFPSGSLRKCRQCMGTDESIKSQVKILKFMLV